MLSMLISIESILYILFLEKYFFLKFYQYSPYLWMAAHASDWSNSLNQRRRGGKWNTMVMMFLGGVVLMLGGIFVLFLP